MKTTLQVTSWIALVIGALTIFNGFGMMASDPSIAGYDFLGGAMFAGEAILALIYVNQTKNAKTQ